MSSPIAPTKSEVLSDALLLAANTLAIEKIAADERRDKREFIKTLALAIVVGLPAIIAACAAGYAAVRIDHVGHEVNGMKSELVEEVRKASFAKGLKAQEDKDKEPSKQPREVSP